MQETDKTPDRTVRGLRSSPLWMSGAGQCRLDRSADVDLRQVALVLL